MQNLKKVDIDPSQSPVLEKILNYGVYEVFQIDSVYVHNTVSKQTYEFNVLNNDVEISPEIVTTWLKEIRKIDPKF